MKAQIAAGNEKNEQYDIRPLLDLIAEAWDHEYGLFKLFRGREYGKVCMKLELHTGGWSKNEEIITAMKKCGLFLFWTKSEAGGHYYFSMPLDLKIPYSGIENKSRPKKVSGGTDEGLS